MRPSEALALHSIRIREIALNHHVSSVRVFGSALHGDDVAGSALICWWSPRRRPQ